MGEAFIHVYIVILIHSAKVLLLDNHVSFGNIVFGLASAQHSTGFVGCASFCGICNLFYMFMMCTFILFLVVLVLYGSCCYE